MGCGSSKTAVSPVIEGMDVEIEHIAPSGNNIPKMPLLGKASRKTSDTRLSELKDSEDESGPDAAARLAERKVVEPPLAFEVPVKEDGESLIRKHPPRRFQRLEDQQVAVNLSHAVLDEKQAEAENRRVQIMTQRIQSAKPRLPRKRTFILDTLDQTDEAIETMKMENSTLEL